MGREGCPDCIHRALSLQISRPSPPCCYLCHLFPYNYLLTAQCAQVLVRLQYISGCKPIFASVTIEKERRCLGEEKGVGEIGKWWW